VFGAQAVIAYGVPRLSADVDVTLALVPDAPERFARDMGEAFALADRVGVIEDGRLVTCDRPEVVAASRVPLVRKLLDALPAIPRPLVDVDVVDVDVVQAFRPADDGGPEGPHSS